MHRLTHRTAPFVCAAAAALVLILPGQALASTQVGQTFAPPTYCAAGVTFLQTSTGSGPSYVVPAAGVITSWSFQASGYPTRRQLKVGRHTSASDYLIVGESSLVTPVGNVINTFPTRIPVQSGDVLGEALTVTGLVGGGYCGDNATGNPADIWGEVVGNLTTGASGTFSPQTTSKLDISAKVEPDADHDGFGDETQDSCFTDPSTHGACAPPTVSGTAQNGRTLSASPQGSPGNPSLQWLRCDSAGNGCASIPGATGGSYKLTSADIAHTMRARKTASNSSGVQQALSAHTATVQPAPGACSNVQAHAAGAGNDTITGTSGGDLISGLAGNDVLSGAAGADCLNGGPGNDKLSGGAGNDRLSGGPGNDVMDGGSGNDKIATGGGKNKVNAGSGNDNVNSANRKRDVVDCGSGRDTVRADNNDKLIGCEVKRLV